MDDEVVDAVLHEGRAVLSVEQPPGIGFILGEQQSSLAIAIEKTFAQVSFSRPDNSGFAANGFKLRPGVVSPPRPPIAEPERWQKVNLRRFGTAIVDVDLNQNVLR